MAEVPNPPPPHSHGRAGDDPKPSHLAPVTSPSDVPVLRVPGMEIPVAGLVQNVDQIAVYTTRDKLRGHVESLNRGLARTYERRTLRTEVLALLGISLALLTPVFTSTFRSFLWFSAELFQAMFLVGGLFFLGWAGLRTVAAFNLRRHKSSDHDKVSTALEAIEKDRDFPTSD